MISAVIDTNVLVAAAKSHKPDSSASRIVSLVFSGIIHRHPVQIQRRWDQSGKNTISRRAPDPRDQVFYEICLSVEDAYMVTNNKKHFPLKPRVVTPTEMLSLLIKAGIIS
jgi:predicted nucleic acid-binding protein